MRRRWAMALALLGACNSSDPADSTPAQSPAKAKPAARASESPPGEKSGLAAKVETIARPEPKFIEPLGGRPVEPGGAIVELPPAPSLEPPPVPDRYPDGDWSIAGLRRDRTAQLAAGDAGTEIIVKGWVQSIYVPPECPPGEMCPPPKQPHVWVTDHPDEKGRKRAMLVVNYRFAIPEWDAKRWADQEEVVLELGKQYVFKGKFRQFSDTGFAHDQGLLEFSAVRNYDPTTGGPYWVYPPGAPWHPMEIARVEEENARMIERARKKGR